MTAICSSVPPSSVLLLSLNRLLNFFPQTTHADAQTLDFAVNFDPDRPQVRFPAFRVRRPAQSPHPTVTVGSVFSHNVAFAAERADI